MSKHKMTREQKEKAVELALSGGDYLAHLKECGAKNPSAAWWYIKKTLAKSNPKLLAEVMKKTGEVETVKAPENPKGGPIVEIAEKLPPEAVAEVPEKEYVVVEPHDDIEGAVNYLKKAEKDSHIIDKPLNYDGFKVTAIDGEFGQYRMDGDKIGFQNQAKIMYFSMHKEDLGAFIKELTRAAQILGVQV